MRRRQGAGSEEDDYIWILDLGRVQGVRRMLTHGYSHRAVYQGRPLNDYTMDARSEEEDTIE